MGLFSKHPEPQSLRSIPPSAEEHQAASETVARLLRVYGDALFETDPASAPTRVQACDHWAEHVRAATADPAATPRVDWGGLLRFFSEQRQGESEHVGQSQELLRETVRGLARDLQGCLGELRGDDADLALHAARVTIALGSGDDQALLEHARALLERASGAADARRGLYERQRRALCAQIEELLAARHAPGRIDQSTRLPGPDALRDHLEFVATVGRLMESPPVLVLLTVDCAQLGLDADAAIRAVGDEALRRFFAREHLVARAGEELVAAVLPATDVGDAHTAATAVLDALGEAGIPASHREGALGTLVPGEPAARWWQRCHDELSVPPWEGRCRTAAAPAVFD